jgi:RsmE family RNA methyltransferase
MNFLVAYTSEVSSVVGGQLIVSGERVVRAFNDEEVVAGSIRELCVVGKERFKVRCETGGTEFCFTVIGSMPIPEKIPCTAIIGLSRPQTIKKCIHIAATLGVGEITFVASERGEKSYLTSKILLPDEMHHELELAIAQTGDPIPLSVKIVSRFWDLGKEALIEPSHKLLFHTANGEPSQGLCSSFSPHSYIAIGPEAGWSDEEVKYFTSRGFILVGLGERILRVETALNAVLGKLFY